MQGRGVAFAASVGLFGVSAAADSQGAASFDVLVNLADKRAVHLALTVPDGTSHRLQVDGDLGLNVRVWWGDARRVNISLVNTAATGATGVAGVTAAQSFHGGSIDRPTRADGEVLQVAFSVCGDRVISVVDRKPAMCGNLPPMAKADPVFPADCWWCLGPYEGMPATITSHERIAPVSEPGDPLTLTGRVLGPDGKPRAGIVVYAYHTGRDGIYPAPGVPRSDLSNFHGRLRGWARSDADGRYTFETIRPGSYPNSSNPQHIHMQVVEPGCAAYVIDELRFADDPMLQRLSATERSREEGGIGGPAVGTPRHKGKGWEVTRDIHLGEKVPGYTPCRASLPG
jgi:protocatechuate 3,4-dioxygenase beta subunit